MRFSQKPIVILAASLVLPPVGLLLLWLRRGTSISRKSLATLAIIVWHFYQIFLDPDVAPVDSYGRKFIRKPAERLLNALWSDVFLEEGDALLDDGQACLFNIEAYNVVEDLVNESHGDQLACLDGLLRIIEEVLFLVYFLSEGAGGKEISEDDAAAEGKERFAELVPVADLS